MSLDRLVMPSIECAIEVIIVPSTRSVTQRIVCIRVNVCTTGHRRSDTMFVDTEYEVKICRVQVWLHCLLLDILA